MFLRKACSLAPWLLALVLLLVAGMALADFLHLRLFGYTAALGRCEEGCFDQETNPEFTFQWTTGQARLGLPARDVPTILTLRLFGGPRPAPLPQVSLTLANGREVAHFPVPNEGGFYSVVLPPLDPGTTLLLRTPTFQPGSGDSRDLGVGLREVRLRDLPAFQRYSLLLALLRGLDVLLGAAFLFVLLLRLRYTPRSAGTLSLGMLVVMTMALAVQPSWRDWPWPAFLLMLSGALLAIVTRLALLVALRRGAARPVSRGGEATFLPLETGIVAGLGWGGGIAFLSGLPILVSGQGLVGLGPRLLVLLYLMVAYAAGGALLCGFLGLLGTLVFGLLSRCWPRLAWFALYSGLVAGLAFLATTVTRYHILDTNYGELQIQSLVVAGLLSLALAAVLGWASRRGVERWQAGRGFLRPCPWKALRAALLVAFLVGGLVLAAQVVYRRSQRDRLPQSAQPASATHPNIVLVTVGSLRADALGAYRPAAPVSPSPHLDKLARQGLLFEAAMSPAPWPLAALASLHTSLYPTELGIACRPHASCDARLDSQRTTLAESLQQAGYRTQAYVANPWFSPSHGFAQGFDGYEVVRPALPLDLERLRQEQAAVALAQSYVVPLYQVFEKGYNLLLDGPLPAGDRGALLNQRVQRFLQIHRQESFFLWIHYDNPDLPHNPAQPFPAQPYEKKIAEWDAGQVLENREFLLQPASLAQLRGLYDGEVREVDAMIGAVLADLDAQGLADRTLVVVTGDHGEELGEHGDFSYGHTLYEELVHVPLIVRGPAVAPGQRVGTPVGLIDLLPSLLEAAGAPLPEEARGRSLRPAWQGQELAAQPVYSESLYRVYYEWKALRQGYYKLIFDRDRERVELYDLRTDPAEQHDLALEEPGRAQEMLRTLQDWLARAAQSAATLPRVSRAGGVDPRITRMLVEMGAY